ncbi:MAG: porin family protein [Bacteroidetes bacterium]|nr:porin family protein [Bacteroidota bacterium]
MKDYIDINGLIDGDADQRLRETMAGHQTEPKPALWKRISRRLLWGEVVRFNFTNLSQKFLVAGVGGVFLVATLLYYGFHDDAPEAVATKSTKSKAQENFSDRNSPTRPFAGLHDNIDHIRTEKAGEKNLPDIGHSVGKSAEPGRDAMHKPLITTSQKGGKSNSRNLTEFADKPEGPSKNEIQSSSNAGEENNLEISPVLPYMAALLYKDPEADTIITFSNPAGVYKVKITKPTANQFFSANFGITPEFANYPEPEASSEINFWLNGGLTYHVSRFSIASGFNLGFVYDEGKYEVAYKSSDSIGFYSGVTSYTLGNNNEIIYNTQINNVYDSMLHLADYRSKNRYSYLQVPLLLGYRIFESGRVSLTVQVGPAISILLGSRKSDPVIEYSNARIIRTDDNTPSRIQTNWQIWANTYFEIRMNKQISIYLQPSFKYYLKPMVSQENIKFKSPWTVGLGIGLQYNFGSKKRNP